MQQRHVTRRRPVTTMWSFNLTPFKMNLYSHSLLVLFLAVFDMNHLCTLCQRTMSPSARMSPYPTTNCAQPPGSEASATGQQAENIPASAQQVKQIAKPLGEVNRPHRGGYNLQTTLAWNKEQWAKVQVSCWFASFLHHPIHNESTEFCKAYCYWKTRPLKVIHETANSWYEWCASRGEWAVHNHKQLAEQGLCVRSFCDFRGWVSIPTSGSSTTLSAHSWNMRKKGYNEPETQK